MTELAVQGNATAEQLEKDDKAGKVPKELFNNYTVITYSNGEYSQAAYATYFKEEIAAIVTLFDAWIAGTSIFHGHFAVVAGHCVCCLTSCVLLKGVCRKTLPCM